MPLDPELPEVLTEWFRSEMADVHTAIPGKVKSYDAAKQVADVIVQVRAQTPRDDGSLVAEEWPVLPNVPVQWPRGGGYAIHFPLAVGDFVLLIFSEAAIGHWRETGQLSDPGDLRRHSPSYPIAIPGIAPNAGKLSDAPPNEAVINVPDGKALRIGGTGADFVALSAKVDAQLDALKQAIAGAATTEANAAGLGGMTALSAALSAWPLPTGTAATQLKAK